MWGVVEGTCLKKIAGRQVRSMFSLTLKGLAAWSSFEPQVLHPFYRGSRVSFVTLDVMAMNPSPDQTVVTHPLDVVRKGAWMGVGCGKSAFRLLPRVQAIVARDHPKITPRLSAAADDSSLPLRVKLGR